MKRGIRTDVSLKETQPRCVLNAPRVKNRNVLSDCGVEKEARP